MTNAEEYMARYAARMEAPKIAALRQERFRTTYSSKHGEAVSRIISAPGSPNNHPASPTHSNAQSFRSVISLRSDNLDRDDVSNSGLSSYNRSYGPRCYTPKSEVGHRAGIANRNASSYKSPVKTPRPNSSPSDNDFNTRGGMRKGHVDHVQSKGWDGRMPFEGVNSVKHHGVKQISQVQLEHPH